MDINFDYARARRLMLPRFSTARLVLVGCGGTGSWLAPAVARVARLLRERSVTVRVDFVDPDTVDEANIYRQNFCDAEIGQNKAETLARRFGHAWGIPITAWPVRFDDARLAHVEGSTSTTVLIGAVDNAAARRQIDEKARNHNWWHLDSGNEKNSGQVLLGSGARRPSGLMDVPGLTPWLPLPCTRHPELLEPSLMSETQADGLSCAEMALQNAQGLSINQRMAAEAADYLVRMLITHDLRKMGTYIDLESGACKSAYITDEALSL